VLSSPLLLAPLAATERARLRWLALDVDAAAHTDRRLEALVRAKRGFAFL